MPRAKVKASRRASSKAAAARGVAPKKTASKKTTATRPGSRADFGAPIDGFFEKHPPHLRAILEKLRRLVEEVAPDARSSIKWGMPWFTIDGKMMCSLTGHKAHVNLVLVGPADSFDDPDRRLSGSSKAGRHLKLRSLDELPEEAVRAWLGTAATLARKA